MSETKGGSFTSVTAKTASLESHSPPGSQALNQTVSEPFHSESGTATVAILSAMFTSNSISPRWDQIMTESSSSGSAT